MLQNIFYTFFTHLMKSADLLKPGCFAVVQIPFLLMILQMLKIQVQTSGVTTIRLFLLSGDTKAK